MGLEGRAADVRVSPRRRHIARVFGLPRVLPHRARVVLLAVQQSRSAEEIASVRQGLCKGSSQAKRAGNFEKPVNLVFV